MTVYRCRNSSIYGEIRRPTLSQRWRPRLEKCRDFASAPDHQIAELGICGAYFTQNRQKLCRTKAELIETGLPPRLGNLGHLP